jgi:hypothetical protein
VDCEFNRSPAARRSASIGGFEPEGAGLAEEVPPDEYRGQIPAVV